MVKPEEYGKLAGENFKKGCNCAQSVLCAFENILKMDSETLMRLGSSFGGGIGRLRQVCGAVSGMMMVHGLIDGYTLSDGNKNKHYEAVRKLAAEFTENNGSINCGELLSLAGEKPAAGGEPDARTPGYYKRRSCAAYCEDAARIIAGHITKRQECGQ